MALRDPGKHEARDASDMVPAIVMGGHLGSAMAVARSLGRMDVAVHLLGEPGVPYVERHSRYVNYIPLPQDVPASVAWRDFLLGPRSEPLRGAVLLACSDVGIELLLEHRQELSRRYLLDVSNPEAQACALNKLCTYQMAAEAGVPAPRFWHIEDADELLARRHEFPFPIILKPLFTHQFAAALGSKFLVADDFEGLVRSFANVQKAGLDVVLLELIPGPDSRLASYYTYRDDAGRPLFHFTKRVIRRYPENQGLACYHVTDWNPEVAELGLRLLTHLDVRGVGNVEFKRDVRDGKLKVMEINARFTAATPLVAASGYDLAAFVYKRIVGAPCEPLLGRPYRGGLHLWYPESDLRALRELRSEGKLSVPAWLLSLAHPQIFPYFSLSDPAPGAASAYRLLRRWTARAVRGASSSLRRG